MGGSELFWTELSAIGQIAGAVATAAAVIVSLWIALSERATKLQISAGIRLTFAGDGSPPDYLVAITVINVGQRRVRISNVGWQTGWLGWKWAPEWLQKQYAMQVPGIGSARPPLDLEPGENTIVFARVEEFANGVADGRNVSLFGRKPPWRKAPVPTRIFAAVYPTVGRAARVKAEPSLVRFLVFGELERMKSRKDKAAEP